VSPRCVVRTMAAALLIPTAAGAQSFEVAAGGFVVQRRIEYRGAFYQQSGLCSSVAGTVRAGRLRAAWRLYAGTLAGASGAPNADARLRAEATALEVVASPALSLGVQREVRRFESDAGVTVWEMMGGAVRLEPQFGIRGLRGLVDLSVLGAGGQRGGADFGSAVQTAVGASFNPGDGRFRVRLAFRFERYDQPESATGPQRLEQFSGLAVEAALRLGRR